MLPTNIVGVSQRSDTFKHNLNVKFSYLPGTPCIKKVKSKFYYVIYYFVYICFTFICRSKFNIRCIYSYVSAVE